VGPGDTIVFDAVDRMSRNAAEGIELYEKLFADGVELVFLKQHHIDTATYKKALAEAVPMTGTNVDIILAAINEYLHTLRREQIQLAFAQAEHEVEQLHQRTREGIQTARLNGKQIGLRPGTKLNIKKAAPAKEIIRKHSRSFKGSLTDAECIKLTGLARNTYYKYKKELIEGI
jgi:DNA invertase Pin-like site-specific DNA recombinase